jgi:hypothetical protein
MEAIEGEVRPVKSRRMVFALVLAAVFATLAISLSPGAALANGGRHQRGADVTFTKWLTTQPADATLAGAHMAGVVGGDVGPGTFVGLIIGGDVTSRAGFWLGHARYEFHGSKHSFVADIHPTENDTITPVTATIEGVVIKGWMKGARVTGQYTVVATCTIPTPGNVFAPSCIPGTLHLQRGHSH